MKYVSADIETLGLKFSSGLIEFGAVLDNLETALELDQLPQFHAYIIQDQYLGEPYAMAMHSKILFRIAKKEEGYRYLYPNQLGKEFKKFLLENGYTADKNPDSEGNTKVTINVAGKNFMGFDSRFLEEHTDLHKHIRIRSRVIDPGPLYFKSGDKTLPSLGQCLERAGLEANVAHTAIEDSLDVVKLVRAAYLPLLNSEINKENVIPELSL